MKKRFLKVLAVSMLPTVLLGTMVSCGNSNSDSIIEVSGPTGPTGPKGDKGDSGSQGEKGDIGETGNGISSIEKTSSDGLKDIYTITFTDGSTTSFTVTNGKDGADGEQGIQGIQGEPGKDGHTPVITIGENGNWYIDGEDTGKPSSIKGETGNGISSIEKTSSDGLKDIYTITFTDGSTTTFTVTNGKDGEQGIQGIQGEPGKDGHTPVITIGENGNWYIDREDTGKPSSIKGETGKGISSIEKTSSDGLKDIYTITFTDGSTTTFTVTNGNDGEQGIQGIQGEPGKDGHTPVITIGENGNWYIDGEDTGKPSSIKGETGNGISSIEKTSSDGLKDIYTITFTDGSTTTFTVTNGKDGEQGIQGIQGEPGKDGHTPVITIGENGNWYIDREDTGKPSSIKGETGKGISSIEKTSSDGLKDIYTITFTDGSTTTFTVTNGKDGEQGIQGIQGEPGKDGHTPVITIGENGNWYIDGVDTGKPSSIKGETGNGISSIEKTSSDGLKDIYTITFTDGSSTTFTVTNGKDGEQGIQGIQGEPGEDGHTPVITIGENGNWYIDGEDTGKPSSIKGDKGDKGDQGEKGDKGDDGLSAYEIYKKYHPEYQGTEEDWINDLAEGKLNSRVTISFDTNGGTSMKPVTITYGSLLSSISIPSRKGFEFEGWKYEDEIIDVNTYVFTESITLTAEWNDIRVSVNSLYLLEEEDSYTVLGINEEHTPNITIPNTYNGKPVTSISSEAFKNINDIESVLFGINIITIETNAFLGCDSLQIIYFEGNENDWNNNNFTNQFLNINIYYYSAEEPDSIGNYWFYENDGIAPTIWGDLAYRLENDEYVVTGIGNCKDNDVVIPEIYKGKKVTSIGDYAFNGCNGLTSIVIPDSVTSIGKSAFNGCNGLTSITLPFIGDKKENSIYSNFGYFFGSTDNYSNSMYIPKTLKEVIITKATSIGDYAFEACSGLTSIEIPNSVTSIGYSAFRGCSGLTSIIILDSVTSIGYSAFIGCSGLTTITLPFVGDKLENAKHSNFGYFFCPTDDYNSSYIPENLKEVIITKATSIGDSAFKGCSGLTNIIIPDSVTSIGKSAFSGCSGLTSIEIPNSVTSIEEGAFDNCCSLANIIIDENNTVYDSRNGCNAIIKTDENKLIVGCLNTIIPNSVTSISRYAFEGCSGLTNIIIPNSVTSIGHFAFECCTGLTSIEIPDSVESIESCVFYNCSGLTSIEIPNSVVSIGYSAFEACSGLTSIEIPDSVVSIGKSVFEGCNNITRMVLPFIGDNLNNPTEVYLGYFFGARDRFNNHFPSSLKSVQITKKVFGGSLSGCSTLTNIEISNGVESIERAAFSGCSGLTNIVIPESVRSIGNSAFKGCSGLENITIPDSIASIDSETFSSCSNLISVEIPSSVISVGDRAFENCSALENITIPDSVTRIDRNVFMGCTSLSSVIVDKNNTVYDSRNDCNAIIEKSSNQLLTGCLKTIIPDSVTSIGNKAFSGCSGLTSIEIPESVTNIGEYAFSNCSSLTNIEIPDSVTYISSNVFSGCNSLVSISLPFIGECLKNPSNTSFSYFFETVPTSLKNVEITNGTSVATNSFSGCSSLETIKIPNTITSIGNYAFRGCTNLKDFIIPKSVTKIGSGAFKACTSLTMLYYSGSKEDWDNVTKADDIGLSSTTICYYSEEKPEDDSELYWHYDEDGITPVIWIEEND